MGDVSGYVCDEFAYFFLKIWIFWSKDLCCEFCRIVSGAGAWKAGIIPSPSGVPRRSPVQDPGEGWRMDGCWECPGISPCDTQA